MADTKSLKLSPSWLQFIAYLAVTLVLAGVAWGKHSSAVDEIKDLKTEMKSIADIRERLASLEKGQDRIEEALDGLAKGK